MDKRVLIVAIILLILLAIGGVLIYRSQNNPSFSANTPLATPTQTESINSQNIPESEESSDSGNMKEILEIDLEEQNNSGVLGEAVISVLNTGRVMVEITLEEPNTAPQPAHIHVGKCPNVAAVKYPLTNIVNGKSQTVLEVDYNTLKANLPLAINIHKSVAESKTYVSRGDLIFE